MRAEPEQGPLGRRFVRLAALNILSNLMVPLAGLVDMALLGHLPEIRHLAGVALGSILFDYVYWTFGFLRMATTGLTAQAVGRRDADEVLVTALRGWCLGLSLAVGILLLQEPIARVGFWVIGGEQGAEAAGLAYFHARIWGAPATLLNFVFLGWFLGREQAGRALILSLVGNGANVLLDWIFIFRLGWAAQGAGLATALSQYLMLFCALALAARELHPSHLRRLLPRALVGEGLKETFRLNRDILVRTLALISVFAAFTNVASTLGTVMLAATAVVKQVVTLSAFFIDGYAFATESLAGILDGEGDRRGLRRLLRMALGASLVTGLLFALIFNVAGRGLFHVFTDHAEVLDQIVRYAPWLFGVLATGSMAYALDGYFIGLVKGRILSRAMLLAALVGFAPAGVWAWHLQSAHALWAALSIFMLARALTLAVRVPETLRRA